MAYLIPENTAAMKAFSDVVQKICDNISSEKFDHAKRFIIFENNPQTVRDTENLSRVKIQFQGKYRFNLNSATPGHSKRGWVLGSPGRSLKPKDVDFLLVPQPGEQGVGGQHVAFFIDRQTHALMIRSVKQGFKMREPGKYY